MFASELPTSGNSQTSAGNLLTTPASSPPHRFAFQIELDAAVDKPVQDGIGECRIVDVAVPVFDRHLPEDDRSACTDPVIQNFEQVRPTAARQGRQSEIVEDEQLRLGDL